MKKIIWVLIISLVPSGIFAQNIVSFGPKIGWNSDQLTSDYKNYLKDIKSGFQGGLFVSLHIKKLYIQPEAYFSIKKGALQTSFGDPFNPGTTMNISQTVNLQSIDVPLIVGFKLLDLKVVRLRLWCGPVASFLLNKDYTLSINGSNSSNKITRDDFKNSIWSGQIGAGLDVLMLTFDVGYDFGIDKFLSISSLNDLSLRHNVFFCSIGWRII